MDGRGVLTTITRQATVRFGTGTLKATAVMAKSSPDASIHAFTAGMLRVDRKLNFRAAGPSPGSIPPSSPGNMDPRFVPPSLGPTDALSFPQAEALANDASHGRDVKL